MIEYAENVLNYFANDGCMYAAGCATFTYAMCGIHLSPIASRTSLWIHNQICLNDVKHDETSDN